MNIIDKPGQSFDKGMTYYLAGPMTGYDEYNFPAFDKAKKVLGDHGIDILSPHDIDHGETPETRGGLNYTVYLRAGFKMLLECHGIILLHGWTASKGAIHELRIANALQYPVYALGTKMDYMIQLADGDAELEGKL